MRDAKSVRCLSGLRDASSARVLNLAAVERAHGRLPEYQKAPLFESPVLNSCIMLKHRVRTDEQFLFEEKFTNVTKIVIPFDKTDLRLGGTSLLCGQRGWLDMLREAGKYGDKNFARDKQVLDLLNELPSLDPFLIHERLLSCGVHVSDCYFELSKSDKLRMHEFVAGEIGELIKLALGAGNSGKRNDLNSTARLVTALLSTEADDQLEPLRLTLQLGNDEFRQGIFSWRGFLYYKWTANELLPVITQVAGEIRHLSIARGARGDELRYIESAKRRLTQGIVQYVKQSQNLLAVYDNFFQDLVKRGQPQAFRDFLLRAPRMFVELGDKLGGLAHIVSFWRFRFPRRQLAPVDPDVVISLYADFLTSVGMSADEVEPA